MASKAAKKLVAERDATYKPPELPARRCGACRHGLEMMSFGATPSKTWCFLNMDGDAKEVHSMGHCNLFKPKESIDGE